MFLFFFISFLDENNVSEQKSPDGMPRFAASHLELFCLPCPIKRTPGLSG